MSCLAASIGADTYPMHETSFSMCGAHHVAAGGGKLHELGARILVLEAGDVRGDVVNLLVRFRVMDIGKAFLSTQDLSRCGWETVFPADFGDAYLVRKASGACQHHAREEKVCWYLRVKLKLHNELLPHAEVEEVLEVMSLDRGAGVRPVQEGGRSSSSGPAVPEDIEESAGEKACGTIGQRRTRKSTQLAGMQCSEPGVASVALAVSECISIVQEEKKPRFQRLPLTTVA